jgi:hypothetical protein
MGLMAKKLNPQLCERCGEPLDGVRSLKVEVDAGPVSGLAYRYLCLPHHLDLLNELRILVFPRKDSLLNYVEENPEEFPALPEEEES